MTSLPKILRALVGVSLSLAWSASAADYFNVNFATQNVGDNYTCVAGVGTNTNIVGALPDHITYAAAVGDYSLTVDADKRLRFTATGTASDARQFQVFSSHGTPAAPETWFVQFDYTRLATSSFIVGVNFFNNVGQNMLGHQNNLTLFTDSIGGDNSYTGAAMVVGTTYTIRMEIDSGTSTCRVYSNGILIQKAGVPRLTAVNTSGGFGGIGFRSINNPTDFNVTNISGGVVTHSISGTVTVTGGSGLAGVTVSDGTRTATTNGSGVYTIANVPDSATAYTVTPSLTGCTFTPTNLSVTVSGADVTGKDFVVPAHSISGTVTHNGAALSGVTVSDGTRTATTNGSGAYTIANVPDSATAYTVTPKLTGYTFTPASLSVTLSGVDVTGKNFATATADTNYFNVNFATQNVGDNFTSVAGVGTNTNIVGALPDHLTHARAAGDYSLTVDASKRLVYTSTVYSASQRFQVFSAQSTPTAPQTWFIQFDCTRLATSNFIIGANFVNNYGENMLGHQNSLTLFHNSIGGAATMAVGSTYTIRIEIDSGTSNCRVYSNGILLLNAGNPLLTASNTTNRGFGGINIWPISGNPTDFVINNISGGKVIASGSFSNWAAGFSSPALSNTAADADPDGDGLANSVEYVLGTDPRYGNPGGPTAEVNESGMFFIFTRSAASKTSDVGLQVQVSTDLADWTTNPSYTIGETTGTSSPGVIVVTDGSNNDTIAIDIPQDGAEKKFARLHVAILP